MTAVRRVCPCRTVIESEPGTEEHAQQVHEAEPEHRRFEYSLRAELAPTYDQVKVA